jgi:hypothetical protein
LVIHRLLSIGRISFHTDRFHIERVWKAAKRLAQEEGLVDSIQVIELGAILHDVKDAKYSGRCMICLLFPPLTSLPLRLTFFLYVT